MRSSPSRRLAVAAGLVLIMAGLGPAASAAPVEAGAEGSIRYAGSVDAVPGSYIVVFKDSVEVASAESLRKTAGDVAERYGASVRFTYTASLRGFAMRASEQQARRLAGDPRVAYVEQDKTVTAFVAVQPSPPSWGLDRIDERSLPMDNKYHYPNKAPSVTAYIIDTGIRISHPEFGGRASIGIDTVGGNGDDCNGHGTHVAGIVGGATVGVAKSVRLISVRVLNCSGAGTVSGVIAGVDWVTAHARTTGAPAVANMSLGGTASAALDAAVNNSISANVHYSIAADNSPGDSCATSPARVPRATTVGPSNSGDVGAYYTSGRCLDLFAPGVGIYSAWPTGPWYATLSGSSMAAPHATGVAALWRQRFPADNADAVAAALAANATPGVLSGLGPDSPNLLLFSNMIPV